MAILVAVPVLWLANVAPASPSTDILDDFNRGNENPVSQWDNWAPAGIAGGTPLPLEGGVLANGNSGTAYRVAENPGDMEAFYTIGAKPTNLNGQFLFVALRDVGTAAYDGYALALSANGAGGLSLLLRRYDNGQPTQLASVAVSAASGDKVLLKRIGSSLEGWLFASGSWTLRVSATDAAYSGGKIGVRIHNSGFGNGGGTMDDFGGTGSVTPEPPPLAPPVTPLLDDFNRPNETPVSQNGKWSSRTLDGGQGLRVVSNTLTHPGGSGSATAYRIAEYPGDMEAYFTLAVAPGKLSRVSVLVSLRDVATAGWDGYELQLHRTNDPFRWYINRWTNGTSTQLASWDESPFVTQRMLLRRVGPKLQAWLYQGGAWTLKQTVTDAAPHPAGGKLGARFNYGGFGAAGSADDFGGGAIGDIAYLAPATGQSRGTCSGRGRAAIAASRCLSDPVNTLTGAFITQVEDVSLPGTGASFAWGRTYDSTAETAGRLGSGWTDSYAVSLQIEGDGDVLLHGEEGQEVFYARQPDDGSFIGAPGALSRLSAIEGGYELVHPDRTTYAFDAQGRLVSIEDRNGQGLAFSYDGQGRLGTITDATNRTVTLSYHASNLVSQVSMQDGRSVSYGYTADRLTSVTDVRGETWTYTYDGGGRLATIVDPLNRTQVTNMYGADGRVSSQTDALEKTTTFAWDPATQVATVTDANGKVWKDDYELNALVTQIDPQSGETQYVYDADLNQIAVNGPTGEVTRMTYDAAGNMLQATAPATLGSAQKTFVYNTSNDPTQVTDARGKVTAYTYDDDGNTETVTQDGTLVGSYTYDPAGRVLTFTDGNEKTTTYEYFPNGNLSAVIDPLGNKTTYTYDAAGRVLTRVDPKGNVQGGTPADFTWSYTYNEAGQVLTETDPLANVTTHTYDDAGNELTVTDANSKTTTYAYDDANRLTSVTAPDTGVTSYTYDNVGNKLTEKDPLDHVTTHTYDPANRLASTTTATGAKTTFFYDANGNLTRQVEPRGNVQGANPDDFDTLFTYDAAGRLLTETDPLGNVTTHTYDAVGNELTLKDARGKTTTYAYDGKNRLASMTAPTGGGVTSYTYDDVGNKLTETDPRGKTTTYTYDGGNRLLSMTTPTDGKTTYAYDANGNQVAMVEPRGNAQGANPADYTWTYTYDRTNRRRTETDPLGNVTTTSYDNVGNQLALEDANEHTTSYTYDGVNRLKTVTAPDLGVTTYTYDVAGNMTSRKDANEHTTTYAYDADNRRTTVTSPIGQVWTTSYDAASNILSVVDANGNATPAAGDGQTSYSYDRAGRLAGIDYSDDTSDVRFLYDEVGNRTLMLDGVGVGSSMAAPVVDDFNRADENPLSQGGAWSAIGTDGSKTIRVLGQKAAGTHTSYVSRSHRLGVLADLAASVTIAAKPGNGNRVAITLSLREVGSASWDGYRVMWYENAGAADDILRVERMKNNASVANLASLTREFSAGHKLGVRRVGSKIEVWIDDGSGWSKVLEPSDATYPDGLVGLEIRGVWGRLDDFALQAYGETYAYDDVNRLTSVARGDDVFSYQHDLAGNVTRRTYPDGTVIDYAYDDDSRMQSVTSASETTTYGYDAAGNLTQTTLPAANGYVETRAYDRAGRLTEVSSDKAGTPLARFVSTLDPVGNPLQIERTGSLVETQTYTYDPNDRLLSVCFQTGTCPGANDPFIRWTYDEVGNRLTEQRPAGTTTYTHNNADQLTQAGTTAYTYDSNGNQLSAGNRAFVYDLANRLKATTLGSTSTSYAYDGDGKRLQAATGAEPSDVTKLLWDPNHGLPQIAFERDGADALRRGYTYGAHRLSMTTSTGSPSYYLYDALGSVANLTSAAGETQWTYAYEPFGTTSTEQNAPGAQPDNVMKFTGGYLDPTGLYHLRARQYDAALGRFLSLDPARASIVDPVESSYLYAAARPTVLIDPSGLRFTSASGQRSAHRASSPADGKPRHLAASTGAIPHDVVRDYAARRAETYAILWGIPPLTRAVVEFPVEGGGPRGNTGLADIVIHGDKKGYVWEVKSRGSVSDGPPTVKRYVEQLNSLSEYEGTKFIRGFALFLRGREAYPVGSITYIMWDAYPGVVGYDVTRAGPKPATIPELEPNRFPIPIIPIFPIPAGAPHPLPTQ